MIRTVKNVFYILIAIYGIAALLFSLFYLFHDHEYLADWYTSLNSCFYRHTYWQQDFFTPAIKSIANRIHMIALVISCIFIAGSVKYFLKSRAKMHDVTIHDQSVDWIRHILLTLFGILMWWYSHGATHPSYDEIFSAVHCAGIHPFQSLSYYMLPNNHVLFNVLNGTLFFWMEDKVFSGRLLSLIAFVITLHLGFLLLKEKFSTTGAFFTILLLSLSLPILGFASQARGYSLQLMAGWLCVLALYHYLKSGSQLSLWCIATGIFIGYAALPGFLYFHLTLVAFAIVVQLYKRKIDIVFWKYQFIAAGLLLLFYLPAISFSGIAAIVDNNYVKVGELTLIEFLPQFTGLFHFFMNYGFSALFDHTNPLLYFLYLAPLLLIISKDKHHRGIAVFYFFLWASVLFVVIFMKKIPFSRNLIIQYSIGLAIMAYTLYTFLSYLSRVLKWQNIRPIIYYTCLGGLGVYFGMRFSEIAGEQLYFNPANTLFEQNSKNILFLERDSTIAFSNESFFWYYLCKQEGFKVNQCPEGNEAYLVKRISESLPEDLIIKYNSMMKFEADNYEILKQK